MLPRGGRVEMIRAYGLFVVLVMAVSCAHSPPSGQQPLNGGVDLVELFPPHASSAGEDVEITARIKLDLPKYRIRGTCGIYRSGDGSVQIDFLHSSLFGSYRENATILVSGDSMTIQDHEREVFKETGETLALVSEYFDFEFLPSDVTVFLLLDVPRYEQMENAAVNVSGDRWGLTGDWRGRMIEMEGEMGLGPTLFRICTIDGTGCYEARYRYGSNERLAGYPEKMVCERLGGGERLSMEIESVARPAAYSSKTPEKIGSNRNKICPTG
jgi:hypothetical protein